APTSIPAWRWNSWASAWPMRKPDSRQSRTAESRAASSLGEGFQRQLNGVKQVGTARAAAGIRGHSPSHGEKEASQRSRVGVRGEVAFLLSACEALAQPFLSGLACL